MKYSTPPISMFSLTFVLTDSESPYVMCGVCECVFVCVQHVQRGAVQHGLLPGSDDGASVDIWFTLRWTPR